MFNATTRTVFVALLVLVSVALANSAQAGTLLVSDDFNDNSLNASVWTVVTTGIPQNPKSVNEVNEHIELEGRAHLNTVAQFDPAAQLEDGIRITGQWTFVSNDDMLQILTRSDGTPGGTYGETGNGVEFYVAASGIGNSMTIRSQGGASVSGAINGGALDAVAGETYDFEIRDDGQNLYFGMKQVGGSKQRQVFAVSPSVMGTNLVTFHNRESGKRSNLDNVVIESPTAPAAHTPLSDDFNDNWIDTDKWNVVGDGIPQNPKSVVESGGQMQLEGRAHLNTQAQYDPLSAPNDGVRIRGQWTFVSGSDVMQILTRSDGTPGGGWGETNNGLEFQVSAVGNSMTITGRGGASVTGVVNGGGLSADAGETYDFDIRDDGYNLFFTMRQVGGTKQRSMIAASNSLLAQNLITFHNRESGNRSNLDNVRIDSPVSNTAGLGGLILLEDRFTDNSLDGNKWTVNTSIPQGGATVTETNYRAQIVGRAHLNTVEEYDPAPDGLTVRGRWTFQSGDDVMQILTRSDGTPTGSYGETANGVEFVASETSTSSQVRIGARGGAAVSGGISANLDILAGETYDFQILDDGNEVSLLLVQVGGPKAGVATATSTSVMGNNLVTFHNRESGRVSHLDNVVIASGMPEAVALAGGGDFQVREVQSTGTISNLADADALLAGTGVAAQAGGPYGTINFGAGSSGLFGGDDAFLLGGGDNFAVEVTGKLGILEAGDYVFGLNIDDGARLMIDDQLVILDDTQGSEHNVYGHLELDAGTHNLNLVFFHQDGTAQLELFYFDGAGTRFLATAVPEPGAALLLALGGLCLALLKRPRRRASQH